MEIVWKPLEIYFGVGLGIFLKEMCKCTSKFRTFGIAAKIRTGDLQILTAQLCWLVQYSTVQYSTVEYGTVQYSWLYSKYTYIYKYIRINKYIYKFKHHTEHISVQIL